jgi:RNA polymerase primary sigma factor
MRAQAAVSRKNDSHLSKYFREVAETDLLAADEEQDLALRVQEGDVEARDEFVRANLRFVVTIARQHIRYGLTLEDLIQEGNLGLVHAVEHFDPNMNVRFSTYARYWIRQSIQQALERVGPMIRVPGYAVDLVVKWRRVAAQLNDALGRPPTEEEIAAALQLKPRQLRIIQKALRIYNHPAGSALDDVTLDLKPQEHEHAPRARFSLEKTEELQQVLALLDRLDEREATVLRMRFGLDGNAPRVLRDIGERLGMTRERARQIERDALAKLQQWLAE